MSITRDKQHSMDLLRAALRETTGDPQADKLLQASLRASLGDDPDLLRVYEEETAPSQAKLALHLDVDDDYEHETRADRFGVFVRYIADAVKQGAKSLSGKERLASNLLIGPITTGSVGVTLRVPEMRDPEHEDLVSASSVESEALRLVVGLVNAANSHDANDEALTTSAATLDAATRLKLKGAARTVVRARWELHGDLTQQSFEPIKIALNTGGARRLLAEMGRTIEEESVEVLEGFLTGHDWATGTVTFQPNGARKFAAAIDDHDVHTEVGALTADEAAYVRATFSVVKSFPPNDEASVRKARVLEEVSVLSRPDDRAQPPLKDPWGPESAD